MEFIFGLRAADQNAMHFVCKVTVVGQDKKNNPC